MTYHSKSCQAKKDDSLVGGEIDACKVMSSVEWIGINHSLSSSSGPSIHQMKLSGDIQNRNAWFFMQRVVDQLISKRLCSLPLCLCQLLATPSVYEKSVEGYQVYKAVSGGVGSLETMKENMRVCLLCSFPFLPYTLRASLRNVMVN